MYIVHVFRIGIISIPWKVTCSNSRTTGVLYSRYTYRNIRGIRRKAGQLTMRSMIGKRAIYICNLITKLLHSIPFYPSSREPRVKFDQFRAYKSGMQHTRDWKWSIYRKTNDRLFRHEYIVYYVSSIPFSLPFPRWNGITLAQILTLPFSFTINPKSSFSLSFSLSKNPRLRLNWTIIG